MTMNKFLMMFGAIALLTACGSDPSTDLQDSIVETTPATDGAVNPAAKFDPSNAVIPFPNNLLFGKDGTLNIPVADAADLSDPKVAMNALDGFSTVNPMTSQFSTAIDASSISSDSVKLFKVNLSAPGGAVIDVDETLTFGVDYIATVSSVDATSSTLAILPINHPLDPASAYMVVITNKLMSQNGKAFGPSVTYRLIKSLQSPLVFCPNPMAASCTLPGALRSLSQEELASFEGLRQLINTGEATIAAKARVPASSIIQSWSFSTESVGAVLKQVRSDIRAGSVPASALAMKASSPLGLANIYAGTLDIPYYLKAAADTHDATALDAFWHGAGGSLLSQFNPAAVKTSTQQIPLMVSIPKTAAPADGYPVVIYQHGITTNRTTMLALADSMAAAGMAVVAIDMPMHGLTGNETDGTQAFYMAGKERTFDLDLMNNDTSAPGPDGVIDDSGSHFINLANLQNTRDNVRQAVSDLFSLAYAIEGMNIGGATLNKDKIYFLGHSLGAMVGTTFVALEPKVRDAAFAFGGGSYAKILDGSAAFSPQISAGLAAKGVNKGTADYESFMAAAQALVDTADPINFGVDAAKNRGVVFFEIVGGNTSPSDLVVPNTVPDKNDKSHTVPAPLAGTEPLLKLMGLTQMNMTTNGTDLKASVKFLVGNHGSLLNPADTTTPPSVPGENAKVTAEIQNIAAKFLSKDGAKIEVTDASLLQAPPAP